MLNAIRNLAHKKKKGPPVAPMPPGGDPCLPMPSQDHLLDPSDAYSTPDWWCGMDAIGNNKHMPQSANKDQRTDFILWSRLSPTLHLLGNEFLRPDGQIVSAQSLQGKHIGLFFGRRKESMRMTHEDFVTDLKRTYNAIRAAGHNFEIVYVSLDKSKVFFDEYRKKMPWLCLPYDELNAASVKRQIVLLQKFRVTELPALVVVDPEGNVLTKRGEYEVHVDPLGKHFPWVQKPFNDLVGDANDAEVKSGGEHTLDLLTKMPCLVVLMEGSRKYHGEVEAILAPVATAIQANQAANPHTPEIMFFTAKVRGQIVTTIREACNLPVPLHKQPQFVLLDVGHSGSYYVGERKIVGRGRGFFRNPLRTAPVRENCDTDWLLRFVKSYKTGAIERRQLVNWRHWSFQQPSLLKLE